MNATKILSKNLNLDIDKIKEMQNTCALCGTDVTKVVQIKDVISSNFTNFEYFKYKTNYLCIDCAKCLKEDKLRKSNFMADEEQIIYFKQNEIEKYIFNIKEHIKKPFIFAITRSFKKHNSFKCNINYDYENFYIQEEDKKYLFNVEEMKKLYKILNEAYLHFTKDEMLTGNYRFISVEEYGNDNFLNLENILKQHRGTHQFDLLIYMLNSEKRNEYIKNKREEEKEWKKKRKQDNVQ